MIDSLIDYDITPTATRMRVWNYIKNNENHPTADDVFRDLSDMQEKISRATVYNTLNLFAEKGLVQEIYGYDNVVHFDPFTHIHAHFQCKECNQIWDIPVEKSHILSDLSEGFEVESMNIVILGTCPQCKETTR